MTGESRKDGDRLAMRLRLVLLIPFLIFSCWGTLARAAEKPNIVLIYTDDVGFGDLSCYGATRIQTPNIDRLSSEGIRFTDAHSAAATCTPSRFALLTGRFPWRQRGTGILPGDAPAIIRPGTLTLASMLKAAGYRTGAIGKWHLGLGSGNLDWNGEIRPGPLEIGFDYCFLIPATGDRVPCVFVENHRVVGLDPSDPIEVSYSNPFPGEPTGRDHPELLKVKPSHGHDQAIVNGISRIGYMKGGHTARWVDETIADTLTRKALDFIEESRSRPFFLYFATHDVHVPRAPNPRFRGTSGAGIRGDAMQEADWCVGRILAALEKYDLTRNTLVIFSSDNGPVLDDGYQDGAVEDQHGHQPAGLWRAGKYSLFEGGTRVPLIVRWPARVRVGESGDLVSQVDFLASFAALVGEDVPASAGLDSKDYLGALLGKEAPARTVLPVDAWGLALREGPWKFIPAGSSTRDGLGPWTEVKTDADGFLFNLQQDPGEKKDVSEAEKDRARTMKAHLESFRNPGSN